MDRAIQCLLRLGPLMIIKDKPLPIGKSLVGLTQKEITQRAGITKAAFSQSFSILLRGYVEPSSSVGGGCDDTKAVLF